MSYTTTGIDYTQKVVVKTLTCATTNWEYATAFVNRYTPTIPEMILMAIGVTAIIVTAGYILLIVIDKFNRYFDDIHTIAENTKKPEKEDS